MANIFDSETPYVINGSLWVGKTGTQLSTSNLQLGPGTATAGTSPLKFTSTSAVLLTTPEDGAMEYDGTSLYFTVGSTRSKVQFQGGADAGNLVITSNSANALAVGANGTTNPVLNVNASASSVATGLTIVGAAVASGLAVQVTSSGTNEALTIDAKGSGTIGLNTVSTTSGAVTIGNATSLAGVAVNGPANITSSSATSLTVGPNGTTTPIFAVASNTTSAVTGLKVTGAATGVAVALIATDSGSNTPITIDGKGTGTIGINTLSTTSGLVTIGNSTSLAGLKVNGLITSSTALSSFNANLQTHTPTAVNATATLTATQVATGYITSTSASATTMTLPTGTLLGTALGAVQGTIHDLYIDNTAGASTVTIAVAVNGIISAAATAGSGAGAGLLTVPSGVTGQACFRLMFSSATAYTFSRIA
jgi:hypothetical protein